jgi:hypothetical protein
MVRVWACAVIGAIGEMRAAARRAARSEIDIGGNSGA